MFWSTKKSPRQTSTRLNVEGLDRRDTPSTTAVLSGNTLNIVGDNSANTVQIAIVDATNQVLVHADGHDFTFTSSQVKTIKIDLKGGDDVLGVQMGLGNEPAVSLTRSKSIVANLGDGDDQANFTFGGLGVSGRVIAANLNINVHAGNGNDEVVGNFGETKGALTFQTFMGNGDDGSFANLWGKIDAGATTKIDMHGEAGNDSLSTFDTYVNGYDQVDIDGGGLLDISLNGGDGNDSLNTTYGGIDRGSLKVREDGGNGNDHVTADIHLRQPPFTFFPVGSADVVLRGGGGFDGMELDVYGRAFKHRFEIDGGSGLDRAKGTSNVTIINANELGGIVLHPPPGTIGNTL